MVTIKYVVVIRQTVLVRTLHYRSYAGAMHFVRIYVADVALAGVACDLIAWTITRDDGVQMAFKPGYSDYFGDVLALDDGVYKPVDFSTWEG